MRKGGAHLGALFTLAHCNSNLRLSKGDAALALGQILFSVTSVSIQSGSVDVNGVIWHD